MPTKQTIINIDDNKLKSILDKVESRTPLKPKEGMTLREVIIKSKVMINKALKRGYTYEEIADILTEEGISIKAATLKQYLAESTKSKRRKAEPNSAPTGESSTQTAEEKTNTLPEVKTEVLAEAKPEAKPEVKPEVLAEAKPEVKPDIKPKSIVRGNFANIPSNDEL